MAWEAVWALQVMGTMSLGVQAAMTGKEDQTASLKDATWQGGWTGQTKALPRKVLDTPASGQLTHLDTREACLISNTSHSGSLY